jgi:hypothetical protein
MGFIAEAFFLKGLFKVNIIVESRCKHIETQHRQEKKQNLKRFYSIKSKNGIHNSKYKRDDAGNLGLDLHQLKKTI